MVEPILVCAAFLPEDLEAVNGRNVGEWAILWIKVGVCLEEDVREAEAEVGSVDV